MDVTTGYFCRLTSRAPCPVVWSYRLALPVENPAANDLLLALKLIGGGLLRPKQFPLNIGGCAFLATPMQIEIRHHLVSEYEAHSQKRYSEKKFQAFRVGLGDHIFTPPHGSPETIPPL